MRALAFLEHPNRKTMQSTATEPAESVEPSESYGDHIARMADEIRHEISEGGIEHAGYLTERFEAYAEDSEWREHKGHEQIEADLFDEMEDLLNDEDAFDLLAARGGFQVEVAAMAEFLGENLYDWWKWNDEWPWISYDDATETWIGAEFGGQTIGPKDDHDALELFRLAKELAQYCQ